MEHYNIHGHKSLTKSDQFARLNLGLVKVGRSETPYFLVNLFLQEEPVTQEVIAPQTNTRSVFPHVFNLPGNEYNIVDAPVNVSMDTSAVAVLAYSLSNDLVTKEQKGIPLHSIAFVTIHDENVDAVDKNGHAFQVRKHLHTPIQIEMEHLAWILNTKCLHRYKENHLEPKFWLWDFLGEPHLKIPNLGTTVATINELCVAMDLPFQYNENALLIRVCRHFKAWFQRHTPI